MLGGRDLANYLRCAMGFTMLATTASFLAFFLEGGKVSSLCAAAALFFFEEGGGEEAIVAVPFPKPITTIFLTGGGFLTTAATTPAVLAPRALFEKDILRGSMSYDYLEGEETLVIGVNGNFDEEVVLDLSDLEDCSCCDRLIEGFEKLELAVVVGVVVIVLLLVEGMILLLLLNFLTLVRTASILRMICFSASYCHTDSSLISPSSASLWSSFPH